MRQEVPQSWLALVIGNSRLHWARFVNSKLEQAWDTAHLTTEAIAALTAHHLDFNNCSSSFPEAVRELTPAGLPLWVASVIPAQTPLWQAYPLAHVLTLDQVPLHGLYATIGIDRALALWGVSKTLGLPALVIDAGTALTFTAANATGQFAGGAILPGVQLQMRSLTNHTATLPALNSSDLVKLPQRWATNTADAIQSGVIYSLLAAIQDFIKAWQQQSGGGAIVLTGGDSALLFHFLQHQASDIAAKVTPDPYAIFWGIQAIAENEKS